MRGHFDKADVTPRKHLVELRTADASEYTLGQELTAEVFEAGEIVDVTGVSKGKGSAGVMKRHGFHGLRASHGVHRKHRSPGSIGGCATPGRVFKGLKMAGRMGDEQVTMQNLTVHAIDAERGLILVKGAVPGPKGGLVVIRSAAKGAGMTEMSTVDVVVVNGDKVSRGGSRELPGRAVRRPGQHPADPPGRGGPAGRRPSGHPQGQAPWRGVRWWRQAVPPEGHRPRPSGLDPRAAVHRWWRRARPHAA